MKQWYVRLVHKLYWNTLTTEERVTVRTKD
jgi:hypothetical protein